MLLPFISIMFSIKRKNIYFALCIARQEGEKQLSCAMGAQRIKLLITLSVIDPGNERPIIAAGRRVYS